MEKSCVIIGASHAGSQAAISLRQGGWEGEIILIGEETDLPYHRPPLSKAYLSGEKELDQIMLRAEDAYRDANVKLRLGHRAVRIEREAKAVILDNGDRIEYDRLVLATGSRVRRLTIPGAEHKSVFYLRDTVDVRRIKAQVEAGRRAVVIGGGYIGLEVAASLRKQGLEVTVLEAMARILQRVTCPEMSDFFRRLHTEEGAVIREGVGASSIEETAGALRVHTDDGGHVDADFIVVGIGILPNTELAEAAGLEVENGIIVNEFCQTSDPDIYAAGDATWHYCPFYDRHVRLESVPNATEQAKTLALHLNGTERPYKSLPWFWSDQYDVKLQIAGLSDGYDDIVVRGDIEKGRSFAVFYFQGDRILAVDAANAPREYMTVRGVLTKGEGLKKKGLADPGTDLKSLVVS